MSVTVRPASSAVRLARSRGLLNTVTGARCSPVRTPAIATACSSPSSVRSSSVIDVCCPVALQVVWPCRISAILETMRLSVPVAGGPGGTV